MKFIRVAALTVAGIVSLLALTATWIAVTFDPNDYKADLVELVKAKTQRTLRIDGDIRLSFWPELGADLGRASLSGYQSDAPFVSVGQARVSLAVLPLLRGKMVINELMLTSAQVNLTRDKDGRFNFADLLSPGPATSSQRVDFDVAGITVKESDIAFRDGMTGNEINVRKLGLTTGRLADTVRTPIALRAHIDSVLPSAALDIGLKTQLTFDLTAQRFALGGLNASVSGQLLDIHALDASLAGDVALAWSNGELEAADLVAAIKGQQGQRLFDGKLSAPRIVLTRDALAGDAATLRATVTEAQRKIEADLKLPAFAREGRRFSSGTAELTLNLKQDKDAVKAVVTAPLDGQLTADGRGLHTLNISLLTAKASGSVQGQAVDLQLTSPLTADMADRKLSLPALKLVLNAKGDRLPGGRMSADLVGTLNAGLASEQVTLDMKGKVDASQLAAHVGLNGFAAPQLTFDATIDALDVDRYRAASASKPDDKRGDVAEAPLDFSALRPLHGQGTLKVGRLLVDKVALADVSADIKARRGKIEVAPFSANAFEGAVRGALTLDASSTVPALALKTQATGIAIAPVLKHFANNDSLEGRGTVNLNVTTRGRTVAAFKSALNGSGDIWLTDGAVRGVNLAARLREARGMLQQLRGEQSYRGSATEKTDFSELKGSFTIRDGIAQNRDLSLKAPVLRVSGAGRIDLPQGTLDYTTRATLAATSKGQGGKDASDLRGLTVPVRFTGPLTAPEYRIDFAAMATEAARGEVESRVREAIGKQLGGTADPSSPAKPKDAIREGLRDLFGK